MKPGKVKRVHTDSDCMLIIEFEDGSELTAEAAANGELIVRGHHAITSGGLDIVVLPKTHSSYVHVALRRSGGA